MVRADHRKPLPFVEGFPPRVVMADTAYDADHLRQAIAAKGGASPSSPNNPSTCAQIIRSTNIFYAQRHLWWNAASQSLSSSPASRPASKKTAGNYRAVVYSRSHAYIRLTPVGLKPVDRNTFILKERWSVV